MVLEYLFTTICPNKIIEFNVGKYTSTMVSINGNGDFPEDLSIAMIIFWDETSGYSIG